VVDTQARRGDNCMARIACRSKGEYSDAKNGRYWRCEIMEIYPKGILKVKTRGHHDIQLTHVGFVLDGAAWGSRMREEIEELRKAGHLIEKP